MFREAAARGLAQGKRLIGQGWWAPPVSTLDPETGQGNPYFVYTYSTHMAEVVVDVETGEVEVTEARIFPLFYLTGENVDGILMDNNYHQI